MAIKFLNTIAVDTDVLYVDASSNNVGIGTTSPAAKLDIAGDVKISNTYSTLKLIGTGGLSRLFLGDTADEDVGYLEYNHISNFFRIGVNAAERMRIDSSGNVGIGITSPSYTLDVNGSGRFSGLLRGNSIQTGTVSSASPPIDSFYMQSGPETNKMMAHPYFMSDLAAFVKRGGTVTVTGLTSPPTNHDTLFRADASIWSTSASNYSGATFTLELSDVDSVQGLTYGVWFGVQFGNTGWAPASMKIEWSTDDGANWTTALDSSAKSDFYYTKLSNIGANITNIKLTIGQPSSSLRIINIFASDYAGSGSEKYHLSTSGGTVYGDVLISGSDLTVGNDLVVSGGDITLFGTGRIQGIDSVIGNTDAVNKFYVDDAISGFVDGSGNTNYLAKWSDTDTITNSIIYDNETSVGIGTTSPASGYKLDVNGLGAFNTAISIQGVDTGNPTAANEEIRLSGYGIMGSRGSFYITNANASGAMFFGIGGAHNNSTKMTINSSGSVGIGTTSPISRLHVVNGSSGQTYSNVPGLLIDVNGTSNAYYGLRVGSSAGNDHLCVTNAGRVGIGTTSPAAKLHVSGGTRLQQNSQALDLVGTDHVYSAWYPRGTSNGRKAYMGYSGASTTDFTVMNEDSGAFVIGTNNAERMRITSSGNVGIGTTSPSYKLDVAGDIRSTSNVRANTNVIAGGYIDVTGEINHRDNIRVLNKLSTNWVTWAARDVSGADSVINLSNIGTITTSGNVGIGTNSPGQPLHVSGNARVDGDFFIIESNPQIFLSDTNHNSDFSINLNSGLFKITDTTNSSDRITLDSSGNVGIGTASPSYKLDVAGDIIARDTYPTIYLDHSGTVLGGLRADAANKLELKTLTTAPLSFQVNSSEKMRITDGGNVGIGTTSPSTKLQISTSMSSGPTSNIFLDVDGTNTNGGGGSIIFATSASAGTTSTYNAKITGTRASGGAGGDSQLGFWTTLVSDSTSPQQRMTITKEGDVGIGTTSPAYRLDVSGGARAGGVVTYSKTYGSLDTTGNAVAGLTTGSNGNSAGFTFTCFGHGEYQKVVYSCYNVSGTWNTIKVIDEGTNAFDIEASANATTITFTFKTVTGTKAYTPRVTVEATGTSINNTYA